MIRRCDNPNETGFHHYGGRGITVCREWRDDWRAFYRWAIENGYADGLSIDRIDVDGDYCPENCRWATELEQQNNRTNNVRVEAWGEVKTVSEWSRDRRCRFSLSVIYDRLYRGIAPEIAIAG